jgi:archaellum component FlaF (FlaF/FlaG flagellin family)
MKAIITLVVTLLFFTGASAQTVEEMKKNGAYLRFEPTEINLGTIASDKVTEESGKVEVTIHNDGSQPLLISQVTACCGTRVTEWPRQPLAPGQKATIKASFRMGTHPHRISRTITVISNAANGDSQRVAILGEVVIPSQPNEIKL